jgi:hypothetical protein
MRTLIVVTVIVVGVGLAAAQPSGSAGSAPPAATGSAGSAAPAPPPAEIPPAMPAKTPRQICAEAMNADPAFAKAVVEETDRAAALARLEADQKQHEKAAAAVQKNERHVIIAYIAMWLVSAGFLLFLWLRQQSLRLEIAHLKRDLDTATRSEQGK